MNRIHIIGGKNSGKTTLIVDLVAELRALQCRVATIKHTHHLHELDTPGKDSYRHRQAGAVAVGVLSPAMNAVFWPAVDADRPSTDPYRQFDALLAGCDLVLVEGHSRAEGVKIEVWRAGVSGEPLALQNDSVVALVSDDQPPCDLQVWPRSDVATLAKRILDLASST